MKKSRKKSRPFDAFPSKFWKIILLFSPSIDLSFLREFIDEKQRLLDRVYANICYSQLTINLFI